MSLIASPFVQFKKELLTSDMLNDICIKDAIAHNSFEEWKCCAFSTYVFAVTNGLVQKIQDLFPIADANVKYVHPEIDPLSPYFYNGELGTFQSLVNHALTFDDYSRWREDSPHTYAIAKKMYWLNPIMIIFTGKPWVTSLTFDECLKEAQKYINASNWRKGNVTSYNYAKKNGWDTAIRLTAYNEQETKTYAQCLAFAKQYPKVSVWKEMHGASYNRAWRQRWLKSIRKIAFDDINDPIEDAEPAANIQTKKVISDNAGKSEIVTLTNCCDRHRQKTVVVPATLQSELVTLAASTSRYASFQGWKVANVREFELAKEKRLLAHIASIFDKSDDDINLESSITIGGTVFCYREILESMLSYGNMETWRRMHLSLYALALSAGWEGKMLNHTSATLDDEASFLYFKPLHFYIEQAMQYPSLKEWAKHEPQNRYDAAYRYSLRAIKKAYKEECDANKNTETPSGAITKKKALGTTFKTCLESALKCNNAREWRKREPALVQRAFNKNWFKKISNIAFSQEPLSAILIESTSSTLLNHIDIDDKQLFFKIKGKTHCITEILEEALSYESYIAWAKLRTPFFNYVTRNNLQYDIRYRFPARTAKPNQLSYNQCLSIAKEYSTVNQWRKEHPLSVQLAKRKSWYHNIKTEAYREQDDLVSTDDLPIGIDTSSLEGVGEVLATSLVHLDDFANFAAWAKDNSELCAALKKTGLQTVVAFKIIESNITQVKGGLSYIDDAVQLRKDIEADVADYTDFQSWVQDNPIKNYYYCQYGLVKHVENQFQ